MAGAAGAKPVTSTTTMTYRLPCVSSLRFLQVMSTTMTPPSEIKRLTFRPQIDMQKTPEVIPAVATQSATDSEYLTKPELAARLRKTPRTIELWAAQGLIPRIKL